MKIIFKVFLMFCLTFSVQAAQKTALVIGNSNYPNLGKLDNPVNDAADISEKLRILGFDVDDKYDLDRRQMRNAIREYARKLKKKGGGGIFFYAGHGMQVKGKNYLIPINTDIQSEFEVPDEAVEADMLLRSLEDAGNPLNIVVLDACRNNPFARSFRSSEKGLARMEGGSGTLIAYSTAPGKTASDGAPGGRNSPYAKHLLKNMTKTGLSIEQVFKRVRVGVEDDTNGTQTPWETSSLRSDFYFVPSHIPSPVQNVEQSKPVLPVKQPVVAKVESAPVAVEQPRTQMQGPKLIIYTNPEEANVKVSNVSGSYRPGMMLSPGDYRITVSKDGFRSTKQWITIDKDDVNLQVTLVPEM